MAYPSVHKLPQVIMTAHMIDCNSATASSSVIGIRVPFRCVLEQAGVIQQAAFTTANAVFTIKKNTTTMNGTGSDGTTANVMTLLTTNAVQATTTYTPTTNNHLVAGDVVVFSSDHGGTGATPCNCDIVLRPE